MSLLVVFPKVQYYSGKSDETRRSILKVFQDNIAILSKNNIGLTIFAEDALSKVILTELSVNPEKAVTTIVEADTSFLRRYYPDSEDFKSLLQDYSKAEFISTKADAKYTAPNIIKYKGNQQQWISDRVVCIYNRKRFGLNKVIEESKASLVFRTDSNMDACGSLQDKLYMGDGRLYIEVDMNSSYARCWYGGISISLEDALLILTTLK